MPPDIDEIEYAPPYQNGLPASRPSLVMGYDSPSPDSGPVATPTYKPDIKLPPPRKVAPPPPDPLQKLLDLQSSDQFHGRRDKNYHQANDRSMSEFKFEARFC